MSAPLKLSVVIPVYNEIRTVEELVRLVQSVPVSKEIVLVDDGSTDGTREKLATFKGEPDVRVIYHEKNAGKGRAVRTGIAAATGDAIIIQDGDLEYDPFDYAKLLETMNSTGSNVVFGSRFLAKKKVTAAWHRFVNWSLTTITNVLFGCRLTDMETCYKLYRARTLKALPLVSDGFEIEVELTARTLLAGERIVEVPISYKGRGYHEGKKIGWRDGVKSVAELFLYRFGRR